MKMVNYNDWDNVNSMETWNKRSDDFDDINEKIESINKKSEEIQSKINFGTQATTTTTLTTTMLSQATSFNFESQKEKIDYYNNGHFNTTEQQQETEEFIKKGFKLVGIFALIPLIFFILCIICATTVGCCFYKRYKNNNKRKQQRLEAIKNNNNINNENGVASTATPYASASSPNPSSNYQPYVNNANVAPTPYGQTPASYGQAPTSYGQAPVSAPMPYTSYVPVSSTAPATASNNLPYAPA